MKTKYFNSVRFDGDWELDFFLGDYQLRIGRSQFAVWKNYEAIWNFSK